MFPKKYRTESHQAASISDLGVMVASWLGRTCAAVRKDFATGDSFVSVRSITLNLNSFNFDRVEINQFTVPLILRVSENGHVLTERVFFVEYCKN
jgi:hypothetical protein